MQDQIFQSKETKVVGIVLAVTCALIAMGALIKGSTVVSSAVQALFFTVLGLFCALRIARSRVVAKSSELVVVNPFRTLHVPWSHIAGVKFGASGLNPNVATVDVRDDGATRSVKMFALQSPQFGARKNRRAIAMNDAVDKLNKLVATAAGS